MQQASMRRTGKLMRVGVGLTLLAALLWATALPAKAPKRSVPNTPWLLQLDQTPQQPRTDEAVRIAVIVVPEVTNATLQYQIVEPGAYVALQDPAFVKGWVSLPMQAATNAPERRSFQVDMPGQLQKHRRLIRYRLTAFDSAGRRLHAPEVEAVSPNYAYFVCDGIPGWKAAIDPRNQGSDEATVVTFTPEAMSRVRAYYLIAKRSAVENVTWREPTNGKEYKYTATLVAEGKVFDHISFRARGGVWRYSMGKNMWKFELAGERSLEVKDDFGHPLPVAWSKFNLRSCIQQGDYGQRGEQGMFESVGFRLFNLVGVPAPHTYWIQLRIIDEPQENPASQYRGDFWGLYLAIENEDGRFLKAHGLPSGNLYKMEGGTGELKHHGTGAVTNRSDLDEFMSAYRRSNPPEAWWRANVDLAGYYSYKAICECIHHYDIGAGKNYDYYRNPKTGRWQVIPWDIDLTWANNMFGDGEDPFKRRLLYREPFRLEYQNRLREIRDLLFNPEQTGQMIDEYAAVIWDPSGTPSIVEADRRKWDYHPVMAMGGKAGQGLFYEAARTREFRGMLQRMKDYVKSRGAWVDATLLNDPSIPATPTITYLGAPDFPADKLRFRVSPYKGDHAFAALKWRLAEINPAKVPASRLPTQRRYEITPAWESQELSKPEEEMAIGQGIAKTGHSYRVRARTRDVTGRWSHWSGPVEFVAGK